MSNIAQSNDWKKPLSKAKGQDRVDLLVKLSRDLTSENIIMADSLAREGIALARQLGDSLSMYKIGANLAEIYSTLNETDKGIEWTQKCINYCDRTKNLDFEKATLQLTLASLYRGNSAFDKVDSLIAVCEAYFTNTDDLFWQSKISFNKGLLFQDKRDYKMALEYFEEALEISKNVSNIEYEATLIRNIGVMKRVLGNYTEALELQFQVVSMNCSSSTKARSYDDVGTIYMKLEDWEPAMKYTKMAIDLKERIGLESSRAYSLYNMGQIHYRQLNYGEALKFYEQSLPLFRKFNLDKKIGEIIGAMGNIYYDLGEPEKGNLYYNEQLELAKSLDDWEGIWLVNYNKGYYAFEAKKYNEALGYLIESNKIAEEKELLPLLLKNNAMLANTYDKLPGKEAKAKFHETQYYLIEDSIKGLQKIKQIGALEHQYLSKLQKDSTSLSDQKDVSKNQSSELLSRSNIALGMALLVMFVGFYFLFIRKNPKKEIVTSENAPLDQSKMAEYFEGVITLLKQDNADSKVNDYLSSKRDVKPIIDMVGFLKTNLVKPSDWNSFELYFTKVHKDFFKDLKYKYPTITTNELNMCALLKLNLRNKDIAQLMGIGHDSVRIAQNRLSKKLELPTDVVLRDFILKI